MLCLYYSHLINFQGVARNNTVDKMTVSFTKATVVIQYIALSSCWKGLWSFNGRAAFIVHSPHSPFRLPFSSTNARIDPSSAFQRRRRRSTSKQHNLATATLLQGMNKDSVVIGASTNATSAPANTVAFSEDTLRNASFLSANTSTVNSITRNYDSSQKGEAVETQNVTTSPEKEKMLAEARALREKAKLLRAEAQAEEASLKESRSNSLSERIREADNMIDRLFRNAGLIPTNSLLATALEERTANTFRNERWSPEQVIMVLERLHERQIRVQEQPPIMTPSQAAVSRPTRTFQIADTRNAAVANETEWKVLDGWIALLINAASLLDDEYDDKTLGNTIDPTSSEDKNVTVNVTVNARWTGRVAAALKTRRKELARAEEEELKRKIAYNVNAVVSASKKMAESASISSGLDNIQEYTRQTLGIPPPAENDPKTNKRELNVTRVLEQVAAVPLWVPSSLLPMLVESRATLRKEDVAIIKDKVLVGSRFFCTSSDAIPSAAVFRGNIRSPVGLVDVSTATSSHSGNHTAVVFEEIQERLEIQGLANRVQLFMLEDQEWRPGMDERAPKPLPVILAISKKVQPTENIMEKPTTSIVVKVRHSTLLNDVPCLQIRSTQGKEPLIKSIFPLSTTESVHRLDIAGDFLFLRFMLCAESQLF